jgi:hypothetical protein
MGRKAANPDAERREWNSHQRDLTTIQRTALVMHHLGVLRRRLSTSDVAELTGVTDRGALYIMHMISGTYDVPLAFSHGRWFLLFDDVDS